VISEDCSLSYSNYETTVNIERPAMDKKRVVYVPDVVLRM